MPFLRLTPKNRRQWIALALRWLILFTLLLAGMSFMTHTPARPAGEPLRSLSPDERRITEKLKQHVRMLADTIGERNAQDYNSLTQTTAYIVQAFKTFGYDIRRQPYTVGGAVVENIEAEKPGASIPERIVVIGAHYDTVPGCPGANDNASGIAALIEIASALSGKRLSRTIRFVAFANEEPPYFQTEKMGSLVYASACRAHGEDIAFMLSLETVGYFSQTPGSQKYPFPFNFFYPDTGNFIGFVANFASRKTLFQVMEAFQKSALLPCQGVSAPSWISGIGWSDHWSFWKQGYPALMVTDTAPFRYPYYHTPRDTWEKLDYERMTRVVAGLVTVIEQLDGVQAKNRR